MLESNEIKFVMNRNHDSLKPSINFNQLMSLLHFANTKFVFNLTRESLKKRK